MSAAVAQQARRSGRGGGRADGGAGPEDEQLQLVAGTVTVYRRAIRAKLGAAPARKYPAAVQHWLRRFPGLSSHPSLG